VFDSVATWRVYCAQSSLPPGRAFSGEAAMSRFAVEVMSSPWWVANVDYEVEVVLKVDGHAFDDPEGPVIGSHAQPHRPWPGRRTRWTVSIHEAMLTEVSVLHELAHCIAPRFAYDPDARTAGQHQVLHSHGAQYAGTLALLVDEFASGVPRGAMGEALGHFGVEVPDLAGYRAGVRESLRAEDEVFELAAQFETNLGVSPVFRGPDPMASLPFGTYLGLARRRTRRRLPGWSQDRFAARISEVTPCSRRDIGKIETLEEPPTDLRTLTAAACMAVLLDVDPIYMRYQMGLDPFTLGLGLEELRRLNPAWANLVADLDRRARTRPPWTAGS
jgi:hypothetical protein